MVVSPRARRRALLFSTLLVAALVVLTGCPADGGGGNGNGGNGGGDPTPPDTTPPAQAVSVSDLTANGNNLLFELANSNDEAVLVGVVLDPAAPAEAMIEFDGEETAFTTTVRIPLAASGEADSTKQIRINSVSHNSDYTLTATTFDESSNPHGELATDTVLTPLRAPYNLRLVARSTEIVLFWGGVLGVSGYSIYRDGMLLDTVGRSPYTDSGLTSDTTYRYTVRSLRVRNDLESVDSVERSATPSATRPNPPSGLAFTVATTGVVTLTWNAANNAVAYGVYRVMRNSPTLIDIIDGTTYTDNRTTGIYVYSVRALNDNRVESGGSHTVRVTVE